MAKKKWTTFHDFMAIDFGSNPVLSMKQREKQALKYHRSRSPKYKWKTTPLTKSTGFRLWRREK